jgi:dGTPase
VKLAQYASDPRDSRGRRHAEAPPAPPRSDYQRDRDRIVHCTAFRRLVYKTQVFVNHEGDLFRTRLTHSLEVAQLGRSIARALELNEDLVEAIALAHDLGHTPFGHAGQDALQACMAEHGGFEHNLQSLRVVDRLEERYPAFDGLNLTFETREGILKHCSRANAEQIEALEPGGVARRFLDGTQPGLEAQLANLADEIAYNAHDIDDGVRSGLITIEQLAEVPFVERFRAETLSEHPSLASSKGRRLLFETIRRMLSHQVADVIEATRAALESTAVAGPDDVRQAPALVRFGEETRAASLELKRFLFRALYRHPRVARTNEVARDVVQGLVARYLDDPREMAPEFAQAPDRPRAVADYVAGMTDRFAIREYVRLTGHRPFAGLHL